ncbi:MAG: indolepyruvate ferredoxin oxidoreductase family protein, partial [Steroidobacteraceae bacterium]
MSEAGFSLDDKYLASFGKVYLSGMQALVRLPMLQAMHDRHHGRRTAGFISGYRGSPLAGYDRELERAGSLLQELDIRFQPGLNEDLAATACWGTQQVGLFPNPLYEGVFSIWYGKAPGLDRSMDAIKHATHAGTASLGGVLAIVGDDHLGKSSAFGHQSEYAFIDAQMPVIEPADLGELMQLGLFGFALSRYCGSWVGLKLAGSLCESSATVELPDASRSWPTPTDHLPPASGLHLRWPDDPQAAEYRARVQRREAAQAFTRAVGVDLIREPKARATRGIAARGRTWGVLQEGLSRLGIDEPWLSEHGVRLYKPAVVWPIEPQRARAFLQGLEQVLVIE